MQSNVPEYNRRRIYYIKKDFQKRFILIYIAIVVIGIVLSSSMLYYLLHKGIDEAFYRAHVDISTTGDITQSPFMLTGVTVVTVATLTVILFTVFYFWKINRSLHSLAEAVNGIKGGDLTVRMNTSQNEDLADLSNVFNEAVKSINNKITSAKSAVNALEEAVSAFRRDGTTSKELLIARIDSTGNELSTFKLKQ